jgi:hypothetical protein
LSSGWIKLHRKITQCMFWIDKPYDRARAWIDLLLMANHEDNQFLFGNEMVEVKRGSFITSEHKLMDRWGWSKTKVRAFLSILEQAQMIVKKTDHKKTTLTIVNYGAYQDSQTTEEPVKNQKKTSKKPVKDPNKNDKNEKNDKKLFKDHVRLTETEYLNLVKKLGEQKTEDYITRLNDYGHQKAKKFKEYTSHYHTILNWHKREGAVSKSEKPPDPERDAQKRKLKQLYI